MLASEVRHQIIARIGGEVFYDHLHRRDRALGIASGICQCGGMHYGLEGSADLTFSGNVSGPIGEESDYRD